MFGCMSSSLVEFRTGYHNQFTKLNIKQDHVKKLYEEVTNIYFVMKFIIQLNNFDSNQVCNGPKSPPLLGQYIKKY